MAPSMNWIVTSDNCNAAELNSPCRSVIFPKYLLVSFQLTKLYRTIFCLSCELNYLPHKKLSVLFLFWTCPSISPPCIYIYIVSTPFNPLQKFKKLCRYIGHNVNIRILQDSPYWVIFLKIFASLNLWLRVIF